MFWKLCVISGKANIYNCINFWNKELCARASLWNILILLNHLTLTRLCPNTWSCMISPGHQPQEGANLHTDKTFTTSWSGGRVQVWAEVQAPACHLAITPEGYSRRQSNNQGFDSKSNGQALWTALGHSFCRLDWQAQTQTVSNWTNSTAAATVSCQQPAGLKKKCHQSFDTDLVQGSKCVSSL